MMTVRCRLCGRKLTVPKSIRRGFGPVCWKNTVDELWEQSGQPIYTKNAKETLKAIKTAGKYDVIMQDEEWKISDNREAIQ